MPQQRVCSLEEYLVEQQNRVDQYDDVHSSIDLASDVDRGIGVLCRLTAGNIQTTQISGQLGEYMKAVEKILAEDLSELNGRPLGDIDIGEFSRNLSESVDRLKSIANNQSFKVDYQKMMDNFSASIARVGQNMPKVPIFNEYVESLLSDVQVLNTEGEVDD